MKPLFQITTNIWNRCEINPVSGCWIWSGSKNQKGYGMVKIIGKTYLVHTVMFDNFIGGRNSGKQIHHECKNKACCNPKHLRALTPADHRKIHSEERREFKCGHPFSEDNFIRMKNKMEGRNRVIICKTCHTNSRNRYRESQKGITTRSEEYQRAKNKRALLKSGSIV